LKRKGHFVLEDGWKSKREIITATLNRRGHWERRQPRRTVWANSQKRFSSHLPRFEGTAKFKTMTTSITRFGNCMGRNRPRKVWRRHQPTQRLRAEQPNGCRQLSTRGKGKRLRGSGSCRVWAATFRDSLMDDVAHYILYATRRAGDTPKEPTAGGVTVSAPPSHGSTPELREGGGYRGNYLSGKGS